MLSVRSVTAPPSVATHLILHLLQNLFSHHEQRSRTHGLCVGGVAALLESVADVSFCTVASAVEQDLSLSSVKETSDDTLLAEKVSDALFFPSWITLEPSESDWLINSSCPMCSEVLISVQLLQLLSDFVEE